MTSVRFWFLSFFFALASVWLVYVGRAFCTTGRKMKNVPMTNGANDKWGKIEKSPFAMAHVRVRRNPLRRTHISRVFGAVLFFRTVIIPHPLVYCAKHLSKVNLARAQYFLINNIYRKKYTQFPLGNYCAAQNVFVFYFRYFLLNLAQNFTLCHVKINKSSV